MSNQRLATIELEVLPAQGPGMDRNQPMSRRQAHIFITHATWRLSRGRISERRAKALKEMAMACADLDDRPKLEEIARQLEQLQKQPAQNQFDQTGEYAEVHGAQS